MTWQSSILEAIGQAEIAETPFNYLRLSSPLPETLYEEALRRLPPASAYRELRHRDAILPSGRSARLKLNIQSPGQLKLLEPQAANFWRRVASALSDPAVTQCLLEKLGPTLRRRFGQAIPRIAVKVVLLRDLAGYRISVHPDAPHKVVTLQIYLPGDNLRPHLGTRFYHRANGRFVEAALIPFVRNTGYAFAVVPASCRGMAKTWHAVEPVTVDDGPRDSLMVVYQLEHPNGWRS